MARKKVVALTNQFSYDAARSRHFTHRKEIIPVADKKSRRINPKLLAEDLESLDALDTIDAYTPSNPNLTAAKLKGLRGTMMENQAAEARDAATLAASRDNAAASEWAVHEATVGMRDQVVAQFGRESNEAQAVKRKKPSERKSRTKKE